MKTKPIASPSPILGLIMVSAAVLPIFRQAQAQALASIPYRHVLQMAQQGDDDKEKESYVMKISSTEGVPPEEILLVLDSQEDSRILIVDDKGRFEVPNSATLLAENPLLVSNQPRGTLNISFNLEVPPFDPPRIVDGKISYKGFFKPLIELQNHVRKVDPTFGLMGKDQFAYKVTTDQPIRITRQMGSGERQFTGTRTYRPDEDGVIFMIMEAYMLEDNPQVEIPGKVKIDIHPVTAKQAEEIKATY